MKDEEFKKAIDLHRSLIEKEISNEKIIDGKFVGPRSLNKRDLDLNDIILPERHFIGKNVPEDMDSIYVTTFRVGNLKKPSSMVNSGCGTDLIGGIELGSNLVNSGFIKNIDEIAPFLYKYKLGILDIFQEEDVEDGKKLDLRVYECIECVGFPNIGEPICYFETGIIIGILKEITNKQVFAEEIRCWASGYSFCQFEVKIKD